MKHIENNKKIDIIKTNSTPLATFKQGDKGVLILELFRNGALFDIIGQTVTLGAYRANKTIVEQIDGFNINNNVLTINFKNSVFAVPGLVELEIELTDTEGEMTTSSFYIKVNKKVLGDNNLAASDEFNSLKQIKVDLTELNTRINRDENIRVSNENTRVENEKVRRDNEVTRQDFYENTARPLVKNLENFDTQLTENTNQINSAKVGFDGKEHSSLKHRLDADFTEVKEQFNANSYLPFEGENVTIDNSLDGVTKGMALKGRTLQNILPIDFSKYMTNKATKEGKNFIFSPIIDVYCNLFDTNNPLIKTSTDYTVVINIIENTLVLREGKDPNNTLLMVGSDTTSVLPPGSGFSVKVGDGFKGQIIRKVTTGATKPKTDLGFRMFLNNSFSGGQLKFTYMILEGDWTNKTLPSYFEGIKSVAEEDENKISILSTGKNLLPPFSQWKKIEPNDMSITDTKVEGTPSRGGFSMESIVYMEKGTYICSWVNMKGLSARIRLRDATTNAIIIPQLMTGKSFEITESKIYKINIENNGNTTEEMIIDRPQVEKNITKTSYEPYREDRKEILLNQPSRALSNNTYDRLFEKDGKIVLEQNIDIDIFNGTENWEPNASSTENTILFYLRNNDYAIDVTPICDKFIGLGIRPTGFEDFEYVQQVRSNNGTGLIYLNINKSKLDTQDVQGLKKWLQSNPVTVYHQLAKPIIIELPISSIEFRTYLEKTHFMNLNKIPPIASFKAPVDVPGTISTLRNKNESLQQENEKLKEEVDTKTLKLHGQDVELTNSDLDLDFRIFELEMNIGVPINLNMKGMRSMARSPFEMMKILILNNNYDREDIEYKASRYLQGKRITQEEYNELISLMDANELVK